MQRKITLFSEKISKANLNFVVVGLSTLSLPLIEQLDFRHVSEINNKFQMDTTISISNI